VMAPIVLLLAVLFASYWQTIRAYPNNGGAYIVSKDNLGSNASLLAAAALMVDYVLNVAVGIAAGVGALVSAIPSLHPYILPLCLGILVLVTVMNLRGTIDAGRAFALPTYLFVLSFAVVLVVGVYKALASGGAPEPVVAPPPIGEAVEAAGLWLLLRSFAAGCTAMTGVEAVRDWVPSLCACAFGEYELRRFSSAMPLEGLGRMALGKTIWLPDSWSSRPSNCRNGFWDRNCWLAGRI
jgi:amino acid transporter